MSAREQGRLAEEFARLKALDNGKPVSESLAVDIPLFTGACPITSLTSAG